MVRRSILLLGCALAIALAGSSQAVAREFGFSYASGTPSSEGPTSIERGAGEGIILEGELGFSCSVTGEFMIEWFIRKVVNVSRVGRWRGLRFSACTAGYTITSPESGGFVFLYEERINPLPNVLGIRARFREFSILVRGPMGERCQYVNDASPNRMRVTFRELRSFTAGGTLVFARDLGGGPACGVGGLTMSFALTTEISIPIIGIN